MTIGILVAVACALGVYALSGARSTAYLLHFLGYIPFLTLDMSAGGLVATSGLAGGNVLFKLSVRLESLLQEVREHYDVVVLDLPSIEEGPDVECVGPLLDGVLLLCSEDSGPTRREVQRAVARIEATGTQLVGIVRRPRRRAAA